MKKIYVICGIIALVIASCMIAFILNHSKNIQSNTELKKEFVNEISQTIELQKKDEDIIEKKYVKENTKEEIKREEHSTSKKIETKKGKEEKQTIKNTQEKENKSKKQSDSKKNTQIPQQVDNKTTETNKEEISKQSDNKNKVEEKFKCTDTKHFVSVGNSNLWFKDSNEAVSYYDKLINTYSNQVQNGKISTEEYYKLCPYGYEIWSCPSCGRWTLNYYKR